jgi:hypothetical protein
MSYESAGKGLILSGAAERRILSVQDHKIRESE